MHFSHTDMTSQDSCMYFEILFGVVTVTESELKQVDKDYWVSLFYVYTKPNLFFFFFGNEKIILMLQKIHREA